MRGECQFPITINADRLLLRKYMAADAGDIFELIDTNRVLLIENFAGLAERIVSVESARALTKQKHADWESNTGFCYGIWIPVSNRLVGQMQVKSVDWKVPSAELSYFVGESFQRKGFAREAVSATLTRMFGQLNFNRVFLRIIAKSTNSLELAKKLGFTHEGRHRQAFRCGHGRLHDVEVFSIVSRNRGCSGSDCGSSLVS